MIWLKRAHTIIGDLNACGGSKKRRLEEFIEMEQVDDIGREEHTHKWGNHRCRIDRVLASGRGKPWVFKEGWECNSDHTIVAAKVRTEAATVESTETDWDKVREWLESKQERLEEAMEWEMVGDPYKELRELSNLWTRVVRICGRSKRWWKREWKPLKKKARKCKARKEFHEDIRTAKREMWVQWVEEGKSVWDIARVARNPENKVHQGRGRRGGDTQQRRGCSSGICQTQHHHGGEGKGRRR